MQCQKAGTLRTRQTYSLHVHVGLRKKAVSGKLIILHQSKVTATVFQEFRRTTNAHYLMHFGPILRLMAALSLRFLIRKVDPTRPTKFEINAVGGTSTSIEDNFLV